MKRQAPVYFSEVDGLNNFIQQHINEKYFIIVDENTHNLCLPILLAELPFIKDIEIIEIPVGESSKEIEVASQVWQSLLELEADRNSIIINCGGGVVTDFGGFIASTFKRGIKFINIPTSLLAMVDASVGGKTGINLAHSKNQIGTFSQPEMVIILPEFLKTLPYNQILSGFAEMLKHGLIQSKVHWSNLIEIQDLNQVEWRDLIKHSVEIKKNIVLQDPTEKGLRKTLNAGHTLGHALESWYNLNEKPITHGEAIAVGLVLESYIAKESGILICEDFEQIIKGFQKFYKKLDLPEVEQIINYLHQDKKNSNGSLHFVLINEIGECLPKTFQIEINLIQKAFNYYSKYYQ